MSRKIINLDEYRLQKIKRELASLEEKLELFWDQVDSYVVLSQKCQKMCRNCPEGFNCRARLSIAAIQLQQAAYNLNQEYLQLNQVSGEQHYFCAPELLRPTDRSRQAFIRAMIDLRNAKCFQQLFNLDQVEINNLSPDSPEVKRIADQVKKLLELEEGTTEEKSRKSNMSKKSDPDRTKE